MKRVITALLLIPSVVAVIFFGSPAVFFIVVLLVASLCYAEYTGLVQASGFASFGPAGFAVGALVLALPAQYRFELFALVTFAGLALALRSQDLAKVLPTAAALLFGIAYIFLPWTFALELRARSPYWLLFALALNWVGDSAAFYVGRRFGRTKLAPAISPGKSREGAVASALLCTVVGCWYLWTFLQVPWWFGAALSLTANIAGQLGDLAESALKRGAGVKDSGSLLPGHGGWLDRLDSSLFTLPVTYLATQRWPL